ncbi:MAG: leucine zipper domain-containing protein, partial [Actinomycetota bacterium]
ALVAHRRARLTPFGRWLIVHRVNDLGWPVARAAEMSGVSRATAHKWLRRHREGGLHGLEDRSSAPHRRPRALSEPQVRRICRARVRAKVGPHRLGPQLGHPRSTVYGVLRRRGLHRLDRLDRPTGAPIRRYERERPGELVHVDVKKLGRIPRGGGHRIHGDRTRRGRRIGHDFVHVAVDDHTRLRSEHRKTRIERELELFEIAAAFYRGDVPALRDFFGPDVSLTLTGSSRLAGTYTGYRAIGRCLDLMQEIVRPSGKPSVFEHEGNVTLLRRLVVVHSWRHEVEMTITVLVRYDDQGHIQRVLVEPDDQGLFDHVIDTSNEIAARGASTI